MPEFDVSRFQAEDDGWWPLELPMAVLEQYAQSGQTAIDLFMGRGTTGKACRALGMNFIGIDQNVNRVELAFRYIFEDV